MRSGSSRRIDRCEEGWHHNHNHEAVTRAFIQKIARWIQEINDNSIDGIWEDRARLVGALWPARQQPLSIAHDPDPPFDILFTLAELKRMYGQNLFQTLTPKHLGWPPPTDRSSSRTDE
jgi:hypothetical protein